MAIEVILSDGQNVAVLYEYEGNVPYALLGFAVDSTSHENFFVCGTLASVIGCDEGVKELYFSLVVFNLDLQEETEIKDPRDIFLRIGPEHWQAFVATSEVIATSLLRNEQPDEVHIMAVRYPDNSRLYELYMRISSRAEEFGYAPKRVDEFHGQAMWIGLRDRDVNGPDRDRRSVGNGEPGEAD